jgi:cytochrome oxidase Cu insertion factor (SCO1/SenC/PrrC family)
MKPKHIYWSLGFVFIIVSLFLVACGSDTTGNGTPATATKPEWFDVKLTDARTGATFTMNDFAGKVVLLETIAMWCPNCLFQANEVIKLHKALGNPEDLISVSLDVDLHEDESALRQYVQEYGLDWYFAVAPLTVQHDLGNLYNAEYLNPPLSPMLIIDRDGNVHQLDFEFKDVDSLKKSVEPYLTH